MKSRKPEAQLGQEVRRLRLEAGVTLRGLAARLGVSPAHLSDIEHDRRRPSERLLRKIAHELRATGASYEVLHELITGIDPELRDWVARTPGVRKLLLKVRESGHPPHRIIKVIEESIGPGRSRRRPGRSTPKSTTRKPRKPLTP